MFELTNYDDDEEHSIDMEVFELTNYDDDDDDSIDTELCV